VQVIDSRVVVGESSFGKVYSIELNDEASLFDCLMGRCCSVLRAADFEKIAVQRTSLAAVSPESNVLIFSVELYHFHTTYEGEVCTGASNMTRNWDELLAAGGVVDAATTPAAAIHVSRYPGHLVAPAELIFPRVSFGFTYSLVIIEVV
jgi:hypothetical protein